MQFVNIPEQFSPNRPSKHWQCPSIPQVPWPLQVVLGLQNSKTNEKKVSKPTFKSENIEKLTRTISCEELTVTLTSTIWFTGSMTTAIGCSFTCNY